MARHRDSLLDDVMALGPIVLAEAAAHAELDLAGAVAGEPKRLAVAIRRATDASIIRGLVPGKARRDARRIIRRRLREDLRNAGDEAWLRRQLEDLDGRR